MQDDDQSLIKMIKNGAKGYMLKNAQPQELVNGLNTLIEKGHFFPDWASSKILTSISENSINVDLKNNFSEREVEFLKYTTSEMNYREISEKMFCSPRTIENYRDSLFEKLELKSRVGLAVYALKNGYCD
jgi:DNA-binding NarL/FixJ family response regulator